MKFAVVAVCPERAFTLLMSLKFTACVLLAPPTRNLADVCASAKLFSDCAAPSRTMNRGSIGMDNRMRDIETP